MGITQLIDNFYQTVNPFEFKQGQFCWVPIPKIDPVPRILDVVRDDPADHTKVQFLLRNANKRNDFRQSDRSLPIKYLDLRSNEELLVQTAKKRPAIILAGGLDIFPELTKFLRQRGKKHLQEDALFVVPIYSTQTDRNPSGFPPEMITRIKHCIYRQFFYISSTSRLKEGIARFDRIQTVIGKDPASIEPIDLCMQEELLTVFINMCIFCLTGKAEEEFTAFRDLLREEFEKLISPMA